MRPIDADKLKMALVKNNVSLYEPYSALIENYETIKRIVDAQPTLTHADLVPHGRWETECEPHYTCSACKHWFNLYGPTNFCPNCGAKMDGRKENG